ncbi:hypothetical protein [Microbacterium maritypicum]
MGKYTPAPHEARARFISGSIDLIRRRDECSLAEAEETAIAEWERWMEWHNVRVRRGVVTEEPEWEYGVRLQQSVTPRPGENMAAQPFTTPTMPCRTFQGARGVADLNPSYSPTYFRRRKAGPWVPIEREDAT